MRIVTLLALLLFGMLIGCVGPSQTDENTRPTRPPTPPTEQISSNKADSITDEDQPISESSDEGYIALLLPGGASSARWEKDDRRFFEQEFIAAGVEYKVLNANDDPQKQQEQARQAIADGAKVILLVNLDSQSGAAIIAQARQAGVNIIDYDRLTIEGPGADFYVSFDNEAVGRLQGEGLLRAVEEAGIKKPRVAVLNGSPTDNNATLLKNGYDSVINPLFESGEWIKVSEQFVPNWSEEQAKEIFENMLTDANGDIDAAITANDNLASAANSALAAQGLQPIPLTGQDATTSAIQNILLGYQSMTVYKAIGTEAKAAAALAVALLSGADMSNLIIDTIHNGTNDIPAVLLEPIAVTKENIAETVIADGFRTWDEICVGEFEPYCPPER